MRHPSLISLSHDHHHGLALALRCRKQALGHIKPMGAEGLNLRASEFREFFSTNLVQHFRAEEEVLFPLLRARVVESEKMIVGLISEHEKIRRASLDLESEAGLGKLLFELGDLLEGHIRREERELFPLFEQHVNEEEAQAAGEKINKILSKPV